MVCTTYDFMGNVLKQREAHGNDVLETTNTYDDRSRLLTATYKLNNGTPATVTYTYDNVGRLVTKKYGDNITEQMAYNIRGWLTNKESAAFKMQLHYENPQAGATACYNGNISEWSWQQGSNPQQLYAFAYDNVNRLQQTVHKVKSDSSWIANNSHYEEKGITYDRNGNILTLQRTGNGALVDNLTYTYTGNHLTTLQEAVRTASAADIYAPGSTPNGTYEYDANGNMTKDNRKGLEFTYNSLNLLSQVKENGTVKATYQYTANGMKLSVRGNGNSGYDYDGGFVFTVTDNTSVLETVHFPEGQLKANGVNYALTDHLGSTRVMVDANGTVLQQKDYYPFGSQHVNASYTDNDNRYTFSGKELQDLLDLNMYDFGARMYDGALGRWMVTDPMLEKYYPVSPFLYCVGNPVAFLDFNGEDVYGFDTLTGQLSLVSLTSDSHDRVMLGLFTYSKSDYSIETLMFGVYFEPKPMGFSYMDVSKGILDQMPLYWFPFNDSSFSGINFPEGHAEEGIELMNFLSFNRGLEMAAWAYQTEDGDELYIMPWNKSEIVKEKGVARSRVSYPSSFEKIVDSIGLRWFHIHTHAEHPEYKGVTGFGKPSQNDFEHIKNNSQYPHYISSKKDGIIRYYTNGKWESSYLPY